MAPVGTLPPVHPVPTVVMLTSVAATLALNSEVLLAGLVAVEVTRSPAARVAARLTLMTAFRRSS